MVLIAHLLLRGHERTLDAHGSHLAGLLIQEHGEHAIRQLAGRNDKTEQPLRVHRAARDGLQLDTGAAAAVLPLQELLNGGDER